MHLIKAILITIFIDFLWIGVINKKNYEDVIVKVQKTPFMVRYAPAIIVYIAIALLVVVWIIPKVMEVTKNKKDLMMNCYKYGGMLGFLCYAIYDFTNYAIFSDWTLKITLMDSLWGAFLTGTVTYLTIL